MKIRFKYISFYSVFICLFFFNSSCNNGKYTQDDSGIPTQHTQPVLVKKPASNYNDTLLITSPAAVFYHPDSLQLAALEARTDSMVFDGMMHEFFYQMRNARMVITKNWAALSIIESKNYRFLLFVSADSTKHYIDLDTIKDAYGLFVFNSKKPPLFVDMTNVDTDISFYLKE